MNKPSALKQRKFNYEPEEENESVGCGCCVSKHPYLDKFFGNISRESTTHGVKYIGSRKLHPVERYIESYVQQINFSLIFGVA